MIPTDKDIAEFLLLAFEFDLIEMSQVETWEDDVIDSRDEPPAWAIDLSMSKDYEETRRILRDIRGLKTPGVADLMVFGLLKRRRQMGSPWNQVWYPLSELLRDRDTYEWDSKVVTPLNRDAIMNLYMLVDWHEYSPGSVSDDELNAEVDKIFAEDHRSLDLLPAWL